MSEQNTPKHELPYEQRGTQQRRKAAARSGWKSISSTVILFISAPILALLITSHVFQSYQVDGQSMYSTLTNGDRLIVYKFGKTMSNIFDTTYMPNRWDIVIFDRPLNLPDENIEHLIKRVIALPGERVTVKDGKVTVYNKDNEQGFSPDEGQEYYKDITSTSGSVDITVGEGEVFVLGDNRSNSADSRMFGSINTKWLVGIATARFVPIDDMKKL